MAAFSLCPHSTVGSSVVSDCGISYFLVILLVVFSENKMTTYWPTTVQMQNREHLTFGTISHTFKLTHKL